MVIGLAQREGSSRRAAQAVGAEEHRAKAARRRGIVEMEQWAVEVMVVLGRARRSLSTLLES